ncbi:MAG: PAS domain S-box protein [Armatimonadota bacterium]
MSLLTLQTFLAILGATGLTLAISITEREQADVALQAANRGLRILSLINQVLVRATTETELLQKTCEIAVEKGGYRLVWVGSAEHDPEKTVHPICFAGYEEGYLTVIRISWADDVWGRGPTGIAIRTGQPIFTREIATAAEYAPWREEALKRGYHSSIAVPLLTNHTTLGAIVFYSERPDAVTQEEVGLLTELAGDLAYGMIALRTREQRERAEAALRDERNTFIGGPSVVFKWKAVPGWPVEYVSSNITEQFGYVPEEFTSGRLAYAAIVHPDDLARVAEEVRTYSEAGVRTFEQEYRIAHAADGYRWVHDFTVVNRDATGVVTQYNGYIIDITERKHAEERIRKDAKRSTVLLELYSKAMQLSDKELYDFALDQAVSLTDSTIGFLHLISDDQKTIILTAWNREALHTCTAPYETHYPIEQAGNWVDCIRLKHPVVYNDYRQSPNRKGIPEGHPPIQRFMSIPVMEDDKVDIIFGVGNKAEPYEDHDVIQLELVANELHKIIKQRHVEVALQESEEKYRTLFSVEPDALMLIDLATLRPVDVNDAALQLYGYNREEFMRLTFTDISAEPEATLRTIHALPVGEVNLIPLRYHIRKDGARFPVEISERVVPLHGQTMMFAAIRNITERKEAEKALQENELRYRQIFENALDAIYLLEVTEDGRFRTIDVNPVLEQVTGISRAQSIGKTQEEIVPEEVARVVNAKYRQCVEARHPIEEEVALDLPSGRRIFQSILIPIRDESGRIYRIIGISRDITERKQAEVALLAAKDYAENLIETANAMVVGLDNDGNVTTFNQAAEAITGYTRAEMQHRNWFEVIVPRGWYPEVWREFEQMRAGGLPIRFENPIRTKAGEERYIVWQNNVVREQGRIVGTVSFGIDITDRKRAEEALRASKERYKTYIEVTGQMAWVSTPANGLVGDEVPTWRRYTGQSAEEVRGWGWRDAVHPDDVARVEQEWDSAVAEKRMYEVEYRLRRYDGIYRNFLARGIPVFDEDGNVREWVGTCIDITEMKQAEEAIKHERAYLASAIELLPFPILFITPAHEVIRQNRASLTLLQRPDSHLWWGIQLLSPQTHTPLPLQEWPLVRALQGETMPTTEWIMALPDGREIPILLQGTPIYVGEEFVAAVVAFQDITVLKEADRAKNQFLKVISHELRTPLTSIIGWTQMAQSAPDTIPQALPIILKSARKEVDLLDRMLILSQILTGKLAVRRESVDICRQVAEVKDAYQSTADAKHVALRWQPSTEPLVVRGDAHLQQMAITEIVDNAVKFTPAGGVVTLSCRQEPAGTVCVSVSDTGRGIAPEEVPNLMEPFYQFHREEALGGIGIGLTLVDGIIRACGGEARITSPGLEQGTTVTIELPEISFS